jgi:hypothetical protein
METLSEAVARLRVAGFREDFRATPRGLRAAATGATYEPESLAIDEVVRFEGDTDPADESILFALRSRADGVMGTYASAYGLSAGPLDAEALHRLGRASASRDPSRAQPSTGRASGSR